MTIPPDWALACVPGLSRGERARRIERLAGGTVNEVYRVDSSTGRYVLRLDGADWRRPGVERARELALHRVAAEAGIAPAIVHSGDAPRGILVTEFHDGRVWTAADYEDPQALRRLGERLQVLHALAVPAIPAFDPWQVAQAYLPRIGAVVADRLRAPLARLEAVCRGLSWERRAIVHGDLWQGNVLDGARLWLLDWEYAQGSNPMMDVACVLAYYPGAEPYAGELAASAGLDAGAVRQELTARVYVYRALTWLWHLARGESADPP